MSHRAVVVGDENERSRSVGALELGEEPPNEQVDQFSSKACEGRSSIESGIFLLYFRQL